MNYEKKYKDALEKFEEHFTPTSDGIVPDNISREQIEDIFSELKESEEERIRKELIDYINRLTVTPNNIDRYNSWVTWLEKQGEKPKKVSIWKHWKDGIAGGAADEQVFLIKIGRLYSISSCLGCECDYIELSELDKLMRDEKQIPKPKWSENDEEELEIAIETLHEAGQHSSAIWLKSLKKRMGGEE